MIIAEGMDSVLQSINRELVKIMRKIVLIIHIFILLIAIFGIIVLDDISIMKKIFMIPLTILVILIDIYFFNDADK